MDNKTEIVNKASRITLKGVKTFKGRDGYGLNATLCFDGKKVAEILDEGNGGEVRYYWNNTVEDTVKEYIASLNIPAQKETLGTHEFMVDVDLNYIVNAIVDLAEENKKLKAACRKHAVVRMTDGTVTKFNLPYSVQVKAAILAKFGDKVAAFVNEELGVVSIAQTR